MAEKASNKKVIGYPEIILCACAVLYFVIPFLPFVDEMDVALGVNSAGELERQIVVSAHLMINSLWYAYLFMPVGVLVVLATFLRKDWLRYVMLASVVSISVFWVSAGINHVKKIFTGELYEPTVGYYMILGVAAVVVIITLMIINKEKNPDKRLEDNSDKPHKESK